MGVDPPLKRLFFLDEATVPVNTAESGMVDNLAKCSFEAGLSPSLFTATI